MDIWSDPNRVLYMAVTSHWIQGIEKETAGGTKLVLKLRADLIGFQRVPGHHDGKHLTSAFLFVTDQIKITSKVMVYSTFILHCTYMKPLQLGWVTLDNVSNNDTFLSHLG